MRPLKLHLQSFGPYLDETIDFTQLEDRRLFVVSGVTGAGKTMIFDAMCYALYNEASGIGRENESLRSGFVDLSRQTSVQFEFELKGRIYRVYRMMGINKHGVLESTRGKYELYSLDGGREVQLYSSNKVKEFNKKLEKLIGLNHGQFVQIMMLPQGEFSKLLLSDSTNKQKILRDIFQTHHYDRMVKLAETRMKNAYADSRALKERLDAQLGVVSAQLAKVESSLLADLFVTEYPLPSRLLPELNKQIEAYQSERASKEQGLHTAQTALDAAMTRYNDAKIENDKFDERDKKRKEWTDLNAEQPAIDALEKEVGAANQAAKLRGFEDSRDAAKRTAETKRADLVTLREALRQAERTLKDTQSRYDQELAKEDERGRRSLEVARLEALREKVKELTRLAGSITSLEREQSRLQADVADKQTALNHAKAELERLKEQIEKLEPDVERLPALTQDLQDLNKLDELLKEAVECKRAIVDLLGIEESKLRRLEDAEQAYVNIRERWLQGQAAKLASHLHDGMDCPVCGSVDHPKKATANAHVIDDEQLNRADQAKSEATRQYLDAKANRVAKQQQLNDCMTKLNGQQPIFGVHLPAVVVPEWNDTIVPEVLDSLCFQVKQVVDQKKAEQVRLQRSDNELRRLRPLRGPAETQVGDGQTALEHSNRVLQENITKLAKARTEYDTNAKDVEEPLRDSAALEQAIVSAKQSQQTLQDAWNRVQKELQNARETYTQSEANLQGGVNAGAEADLEERRTQEKLTAELANAGFADEANYKAAKREQAQIDKLAKGIQEHSDAIKRVHSRLEELDKELHGKSPRDLTLLQEIIDGLRGEVFAIQQQLSDLKTKIKLAKDLFDEITRLNEQWEIAESLHALLKEMFYLLRGDDKNDISFERFVLMDYMEKIIRAANLRLQRMSSGQYYLVLKTEGDYSGLDFEVFDNYIGQSRDVSSMSGGEKFNASLSLALGMADVIQAEQGGVSLDTMFIDEGFGTLDSESLNMAISTLFELQQTGRLIGLISHVEELKQAMPAVLQVTKTANGNSEAKFVLK